MQLSDDERDKNELSIFIYLLRDSQDHKELKEILVFQENGTLLNFVGHAGIDSIDRRGLIKFHSIRFCFNNEKLEAAFINQIFVNVKEMYHKHTHHDGDGAVADRLLPVCITRCDTLGKLGILKQFQKKIIFYNTEIKDYFMYARQSHFYDPRAATHAVMRQGKGEFIYALNFIKFYCGHLPEKELYETVFTNEISSINTYSREAESEYSLWLTNRISLLTWGLLFLTVILILTTVICAPLDNSILTKTLPFLNGGVK